MAKKKPYRVDLDPEFEQILKEIKEAIGVASDSEALRSALKFAYNYLKERGIIKEKT
jgi:Leu/Phe-tRNA-protein transferase